MILHLSGFWFTVFLTEMQRTRIAIAKFEFHLHKAKNVKSFDYNELRKNLNPTPYKSDVAYICIYGIP